MLTAKQVHPQLWEVLKNQPEIDFSRQNIPRTRAGFAEEFRNNPPQHLKEVSIRDLHIPGPDQTHSVRVRIYSPAVQEEKLPALLWMHGGGYLIGFPELDDELCQRFVLKANCVVVSVDYRLAPEHPFPAAPEDCYAALCWLEKHADEVGVDPARIGIGGGSAGGGLAASVSLMARDRQGPALIFQMLFYPMLDDRNNTASSLEMTDPRVWNHHSNHCAWEMYLGGAGEVSPYAAPARAADLKGLPPAYLCVGELDPFRDEITNYVTRLRLAGISVTFDYYPACYHCFDMNAPEASISQTAVRNYLHALRQGLWRQD